MVGYAAQWENRAARRRFAQAASHFIQRVDEGPVVLRHVDPECVARRGQDREGDQSRESDDGRNAARGHAYPWQVARRGGRIPRDGVLAGFEDDHWWTQREGVAAFLALQRLTGTAWKRQAFHLGRKDILQKCSTERLARRAGTPLLPGSL